MTVPKDHRSPLGKVLLGDDIVSHILLRACTLLPGGIGGHSLFSPEGQEKTPEIHLTLNGVELPLEETLISFFDQMKNHINEHAMKIIQEKFGNIDQEFDTFHDQISELRKTFKLNCAETLGVHLEED